MQQLTLQVLSGKFNIHRFEADTKLPAALFDATWYSVTKTKDELSVVVAEDTALASDRCEPDWKALHVRGSLDFNAVGILAGLTLALAKAGISLFAVSTYNTDYIFVKEEKLEASVAALRAAGYVVTA